VQWLSIKLTATSRIFHGEMPRIQPGQESNLGRRGEKRERYLYATPTPF